MRLLPLALIALVSACVPTDSELRARYSREWECPTYQITVRRTTYGPPADRDIEGCGMRAFYRAGRVRESGNTMEITPAHSATITPPRETQDRDRIQQLLYVNARRFCWGGKLGNIVISGPSSQFSYSGPPTRQYGVKNLCEYYPPVPPDGGPGALRMREAGFECTGAGQCRLMPVLTPAGPPCEMNGPGTWPCDPGLRCVDRVCKRP